MKKTTVLSLSLAVLVSFGATSCSSPAPSEQNVSVEAEKKNVVNEETVRTEAIKTFQKAEEIKATQEYKDFYKAVSDISGSDEESLVKTEAILADNKDLIDKINDVFSMSDKAKEAALKSVSAYGGTDIFKGHEETFKTMMDVGAFDMGSTAAGTPEGASYDIIPGKVQKSGDGYFTTGEYVYLKDKNGAIINFIAGDKMKLNLEDNGKHIVVDLIDDYSAGSSPLDVLQSDVQNAATVVETWIVYQGGNVTDIKMEGNKIVSGEGQENADSFTVTESDGTTLKIEGNSNAYVITGSHTGTDEKVIYDSQKGGLQKSTEEEKEDAGVDYTQWNKFIASTSSIDTPIEETVDKLNEENPEASFEVTEKDGVKYVKATYPDSDLGSDGVLWFYTAK